MDHLAAQSVSRIGPFARYAAAKADLTAPRLTIPVDFVGLSINTTGVIGGIFSGPPTSMVNLNKMLGANGSLRIGGADQDTGTNPALTQQIANDIASYVSAVGAGWTVIYGLDIMTNDPTTAATQAGYLNTALGSKVVLQIGNEPLASGGDGFTTATYPPRWNSYYSAIVAAVPAAKFAAPDDLGFGSVATVVNQLTPGLSGLSMVTNHWYSTTAGTPEAVISSPRSNVPATPNNIGFFKNNSYCGTIPQRLTESNSVGGGGLSGISNRFCAAAWYLNEAIVFAKGGWAGTNMHSNYDFSTGVYNPMVRTGSGPSATYDAGCIFYGMYLFSRIQGQQIVPSNFLGDANVLTIATIGSGGNANIIAVNNDTVNSAVFTPDQSSAWTTANVLLLTAPSVTSTASEITLGGAAIGTSGVWSGVPYSINSGQTVTIPPCGAALISIQP